MSNKTYVIVETESDGDTYQIHQDLAKAQKAFIESKENATLWGEGSLYLIEVRDNKFSFSKGVVQGAEILQTHKF